MFRGTETDSELSFLRAAPYIGSMALTSCMNCFVNINFIYGDVCLREAGLISEIQYDNER